MRDEVNEFANATIWRDEAIASRERVIEAQAIEIATQKRIIAVLIEKVESYSGRLGQPPATSAVIEVPVVHGALTICQACGANFYRAPYLRTFCKACKTARLAKTRAKARLNATTDPPLRMVR